VRAFGGADPIDPYETGQMEAPQGSGISEEERHEALRQLDVDSDEGEGEEAESKETSPLARTAKH